MKTPLSKILLSLALLTACSIGLAAGLSRVYLDSDGNVHGVDAHGQDAKFTTAGAMRQPMLAADGETVAWLVGETFDVDGQKVTGASVLTIQRNGRQSTIKCEPFIRDFWFWKRGQHVAIDCGGAHFAGSEILYDVHTLKKIAAVNAAEVPAQERPDWSISSKGYRAD